MAISTTTASSTCTWVPVSPTWPRSSPIACSRMSAASGSPISVVHRDRPSAEGPWGRLRRLGPRRRRRPLRRNWWHHQWRQISQRPVRKPGPGQPLADREARRHKTNRAAIGARIKLVTAGENPITIHRHVSSGSSFGANPLQQTIGLAKAQRVALLEVHWPTSGDDPGFPRHCRRPGDRSHRFAHSYRPLSLVADRPDEVKRQPAERSHVDFGRITTRSFARRIGPWDRAVLQFAIADYISPVVPSARPSRP